MNNEFKDFITCFLGAVALILTIAASAGAISYGACDEHTSFYIVAGICNLAGWGGLIGYNFYKRFIKKDDSEKKEDGE